MSANISILNTCLITKPTVLVSSINLIMIIKACGWSQQESVIIVLLIWLLILSFKQHKDCLQKCRNQLLKIRGAAGSVLIQSHVSLCCWTFLTRNRSVDLSVVSASHFEVWPKAEQLHLWDDSQTCGTRKYTQLPCDCVCTTHTRAETWP